MNMIVLVPEFPSLSKIPMGPFKKYVTSLGGGGWSSKIVTISDKGGRGSSETVMSPLMRKFCDSF